MRVMVTGGLGVSGAWVLRDLVQRGHDVLVFENRNDATLIADIASSVQVVVGDVRDVEALTAAASGFGAERMIHLAAFVDCERDPHTAVDVNVGGTAAVCAAAISAGVGRLVYTSSKGVYGPSLGERGYPNYSAVAEYDALHPRGLYDITKRAAEDVVAWYRRTSGVEMVSMRFATIFGPGKLQRHGTSAGFGMSISVYDALVEGPAAGEPFRLDHGGDERNDLIYLLDVADAINTVAFAPTALAKDVYNVSSGGTTSTAELADAVRRVLPSADIELGDGLDPMGIPYYTALDGSRLREELGWSARYGLDEAVRHYVDYVRGRTQ